MDSPAAAPLEVSVSVPVAPAHRPLGSTAKVGAGQSTSFPVPPNPLPVEAVGKATKILTPGEGGLHIQFIHLTSTEFPLCPVLCWQW